MGNKDILIINFTKYHCYFLCNYDKYYKVSQDKGIKPKHYRYLRNW